MKTPRKGAVKKTGQKEIVEKAIRNIESKLDQDEVKGTVGDLLRLLEYKKQLEDEEPKDIKVTWVEDKSHE